MSNSINSLCPSLWAQQVNQDIRGQMMRWGNSSLTFTAKLLGTWQTGVNVRCASWSSKWLSTSDRASLKSRRLLAQQCASRTIVAGTVQTSYLNLDGRCGVWNYSESWLRAFPLCLYAQESPEWFYAFWGEEERRKYGKERRLRNVIFLQSLNNISRTLWSYLEVHKWLQCVMNVIAFKHNAGGTSDWRSSFSYSMKLMVSLDNYWRQLIPVTHKACQMQRCSFRG